jgi:hypothetical protein
VTVLGNVANEVEIVLGILATTELRVLSCPVKKALYGPLDVETVLGIVATSVLRSFIELIPSGSVKLIKPPGPDASINPDEIGIFVPGVTAKIVLNIIVFVSRFNPSDIFLVK